MDGNWPGVSNVVFRTTGRKGKMTNQKDSEFLKACSDVSREDLLEIMDDIMFELNILYPKKYQDVLRELRGTKKTA